MVCKGVGLLVILVIAPIGVIPSFGLTELERASILDPKLVNAFGSPIGNSINVDQQIQISAYVINNQEESQNFAYLVQIKNENDMVVFFGWVVGELDPQQKFNPSLSWVPKESGEFIAEIFVWEGFPVNHKALTEYITLKINVS
ncbi:MAG: hypothetical protein OEL56_04510 [Nitrosopumilus sp.]|nr:hypothetical protein [Nitrosopumilus sp.]MDH3515909.1 hypothetical protein [Nitrosopumilus sp.]MDH3564833.1 hypothetical protein [Nitrosopumilus sp.]MDH5417233.1 hypothetical protein [Nitrosopumilus sp.]MDH5554635.1 hypothetical protein [Nitrosopumilus sp.]